MSVRKDPAWKHAAEEMTKGDCSPGKVVTKDWLNSVFDLKPGETASEFQKYQLDFLSCMDSFKNELLVEYNIALKNVPGVGYEVIEPGEQTRHALAVGYRRIRKDLRQMVKTLVNVDHSKLTDEQRQENADAQARASMLGTMVRKSKRLSPCGSRQRIL